MPANFIEVGMDKIKTGLEIVKRCVRCYPRGDPFGSRIAAGGIDPRGSPSGAESPPAAVRVPLGKGSS